MRSLSGGVLNRDGSMPEGGHIVAIGGGGFAGTPSNLAIDTYLLSLARCSRPRVGFIPTATGDDSHYVSIFLAAYSGLDCRPSYLPLFTNTPDLADWVLRQDVIFVGGGNTMSMLAVWKACGLDRLLVAALARGTVLAVPMNQRAERGHLDTVCTVVDTGTVVMAPSQAFTLTALTITVAHGELRVSRPRPFVEAAARAIGLAHRPGRTTSHTAIIERQLGLPREPASL